MPTRDGDRLREHVAGAAVNVASPVVNVLATTKRPSGIEARPQPFRLESVK